MVLLLLGEHMEMYTLRAHRREFEHINSIIQFESKAMCNIKPESNI